MHSVNRRESENGAVVAVLANEGEGEKVVLLPSLGTKATDFTHNLPDIFYFNN